MILPRPKCHPELYEFVVFCFVQFWRNVKSDSFGELHIDNAGAGMWPDDIGTILTIPAMNNTLKLDSNGPDFSTVVESLRVGYTKIFRLICFMMQTMHFYEFMYSKSLLLLDIWVH